MKIKHTVITALAATFAGPLLAGSAAPASQAMSASVDSEAGWTLDLEALSLRAFQGSNAFSDEDYDFGGRVALGYQFTNGLFTKVTYFGFNPGGGTESFSAFSDDLGGTAAFDERFHLGVSYLDWTVGKNFNPSAALTLSPSVGLRWATFDQDFFKHVEDAGGDLHLHHEQANYDGLGLVIGLDAVRTLGSGFSLYGTAKASVIFGSGDYSLKESMIMSGMAPTSSVERSSEDQVVTITELGLGAQYDFSFYNITGNLRAGLEGQLWTGLDNSRSEMGLTNNNEIAGLVIGTRFRF